MTAADNSIEKLIRPDIWGLEPYAAVDPPEVLARRCGLAPEQVLKLDANENPYGCSPAVHRALAKYAGYHIYPDPLCSETRNLLAGYVGVDAERILVGNGSDEIIDLVMRLFLREGEGIVICPPTFGYYASSVASCAGKVQSVPRDAAFEVDAEAVLEEIREGAKLFVVASPNNPTGNILDTTALCRVLETGIPVLVDEAYGEFAGQSALPLTREYENLIVARTFSKWAGLAGLRVGYGIFPKVLVPHLLKIKPPYNVNNAAQAAVKASLTDIEFLLERVKLIVAERDRLMEGLRRLGFLHPYPSQGNFVLCRLVRGDLRDLRARLEKKGIFFRYYGDPALKNCFRISAGTYEQTNRVLEELAQIGESLA
ncbi:MAG: histidinol-phosphate transaminase [Chloroflexi bacterium]|nr:histidinol-phosphate transaminase [Chloroflexota bacterium]